MIPRDLSHQERSKLDYNTCTGFARFVEFDVVRWLRVGREIFPR